MYTHVHTTHRYTYTRKYTYTHKHTGVHTHTHTHTHICRRTGVNCPKEKAEQGWTKAIIRIELLYYDT